MTVENPEDIFSGVEAHMKTLSFVRMMIIFFFNKIRVIIICISQKNKFNITSQPR